MHRALLASLPVAIAIAAAPFAAHAQSTAIEAVKPWSRPAAAGGTAAGFMTVINHGKTADALVAVQTPIAARAELHRSSMDGEVMRMTAVDRVALAPGAAAAFAPGGLHVMFVGLKSALKVGDRAPATLVFASGARVRTTFTVGMAPPAGAPAATDSTAMDHGRADHGGAGG